jgi:transposase-like protein
MPIFKSEQKAKAYYLYFNSNKQQKEIAALVGVTPKTLSIWVRQGKWDAIKKNLFFSPDQEANHLYEELREINGNITERPYGMRYSTKEELYAKERIITMLTKINKAADQWRNIAHEHDVNEIKEVRKTVNGIPEWKPGDDVRIFVDGEQIL